ncbi:MAG: hypothetical protein OJF50_001991 [Nitrospira sp.]|nr:hypothetical protein [Nitrospira sp.]
MPNGCQPGMGPILSLQYPDKKKLWLKEDGLGKPYHMSKSGLL